MSYCFCSSVTTVMAVFALTFASQHIRGPHHPRSERAVPAEDHHHHHHNHPQPHRAAPGEEQPKLTHDASLLHDQEHIKEDLEGFVSQDVVQNMTPEEMEFHYFKLHDMDNNTKLDGLEILQAVLHVAPIDNLSGAVEKDAKGEEGLEGDGKDEFIPPEELEHQRDGDFQFITDMIDQVFAEDDIDRDGYLSYVEYTVAKRRDETRRLQNEAKEQESSST